MRLRDPNTKEFLDAVDSFIRRRCMLHRGVDAAPVLVALSGGADSVALLSALIELGFDCIAAHCNFHLRGEESMRDMRHCESLCKELGVDIYVKDFNVPERMKATGESVEMACRELRYSWFAELLDRDFPQAVAVGHHREDQAETLMLNLIRGTGIAGLTGMKPRNGNIVRPLLEVSRKQIEDYLAAKGLTYVTDSSNVSDAHRRNRLRNMLFPMMEELFPGAIDGLLRTVANLVPVRAFYDEAMSAACAPYRNGDDCTVIDLVALSGQEHADIMLFEMLRPLGFNATQTHDMLRSAAGSGLRFDAADGSGNFAELDRGILTLNHPAFSMQEPDAYDIDLDHDILRPVSISVSRHDVSEFHPAGRGAMEVCIDASALDGSPRWQLRHSRRGDRMAPYGMTGTKLVSDLFSDAKYSAAQKRAAWILTRDDEILWIPGLRTSAHFTIGPSTREFIRLRIIE